MSRVTQARRVLAMPSLLEALAAALRDLVIEPARRARTRRNTVAELSRLDDRLLADIGITRGDIPELVARLTGRAARAGRPRRRLGARMRAARARRALIRELENLPDWALRDVGVLRGQIPEVVDEILARGTAPARAPEAPTAHRVQELRERVEAAVRPLRQWHISRVAAGQLSRLDPEALADLGYVKGDVDWVPEVLAKRRLERAANRNDSHVGAA